MKMGYVTLCALLAVSVAGTSLAADKVCKLAIAGNDVLQYDKKELQVAADCSRVELTLTHTGKLPLQTMGHSWVLTRTADSQAVIAAGAAAGLQNNYQLPGDKRIIAATKLVGGGQSTSVTFSTSSLKKGEAYTYFCSFPGHAALMTGKFTFG